MHFFVEIIPKEFPGLTNETTVICTINTMRTAQGSKMPQCILYLRPCQGKFRQATWPKK